MTNDDFIFKGEEIQPFWPCETESAPDGGNSVKKKLNNLRNSCG